MTDHIAGKDFVAGPAAGVDLPEGLDYAVAERHIAILSRMACVANSGISVFDSHLGKHIFVSYNFAGLFGYDMRQVEQENTDYFNEHIHPDDLERLNRNGDAVLRYFESGDHREEMMQGKMISEYRLCVGDRYIRVIEQFQVLELDKDGKAWLTLSVLDVSPNQMPLDAVQSKLMNYVTGEIYQLPDFDDYAGNEAPKLSEREKTVLKLVGKGLYSKEISEQLAISVHTVNTHRQRILEKLNVDNSLEAVRYAAAHGLLD